MAASNNKIIMYGANWCADCIRAKYVLTTNNVDYDYINIDNNDEAVALVEKVNNGMRSIPVIVFPDNSTLTEPSYDAIVEKLQTLGLIES